MFELNYAIVIVATILVTLTGVAIWNSTRTNKGFNLQALTPILIDAMLKAESLYQAVAMGKESLIEYIVDYVKEAVDANESFGDAEKDFLNKARIKTIVEPLIDKLWENKI